MGARQLRAHHRHDRQGERQDLRGRPARRGLLRRLRLRLLGQERAQVPGRREGPLLLSLRARPQARRPLRPGRRRRRDRAVELPADQQLRRLHPGARRRQLGRPQAGDADADDLAAAARGPARVRHPGGRLPGRRRRGLGDRQLADRRGRLHHVHRLDRGRQEGHGPRRRDPDRLRDGARRQGPDDRPRRRQPRARRQRRRPLLDAERRPDLHLGRARLRRGARLRRVRRQGDREDGGPAPGRSRAAPPSPTSAR